MVYAHQGKDAFDGSGGGDGVSDHGFVGADRYGIGALSKDFLDGQGFHQIILLGRSAMSVDIVDGFGAETSIGQRRFYGQNGALPLGMHIRDAMGIGRCTVAKNLPQNRSIPLPCVFHFLKDHGRSAFRHYETIALPVERT